MDGYAAYSNATKIAGLSGRLPKWPELDDELRGLWDEAARVTMEEAGAEPPAPVICDAAYAGEMCSLDEGHEGHHVGSTRRWPPAPMTPQAPETPEPDEPENEPQEPATGPAPDPASEPADEAIVEPEPDQAQAETPD